MCHLVLISNSRRCVWLGKVDGGPTCPASMSIELEVVKVCRSSKPSSFHSSKPLLLNFLDFSSPLLELPLACNQSPYCLRASELLEYLEQRFSSWPRMPQWKQKLGSLSYLKVTQYFPLSELKIFPPLCNGLLMGKSTRILINLACSDSQGCLSDLIYFPNLLPRSLPTSSDILLKGRPHTWIQNGKWLNEILLTDNPFVHLHRSNRLLSKFHGLLCSTHSIWYLELNLNWRIFFPTSTILKFEPILQANLRVLFKALIFWCRFARSWPKRFKTHSSNRSDLLVVEMDMLSSSSLVSWRCYILSMIVWSISVKG